MHAETDAIVETVKKGDLFTLVNRVEKASIDKYSFSFITLTYRHSLHSTTTSLPHARSKHHCLGLTNTCPPIISEQAFIFSLQGMNPL